MLRAKNLTVSYLSLKVLSVINCKFGVGMLNSIQGGASGQMENRGWNGTFRHPVPVTEINVALGMAYIV